MTTLHIVLSLAAPLVSCVGAVVWAGYVAKGMGDLLEVPASCDLRTW